MLLYSMWISNTAASAMMVPIAQSVIMELIKSNRKQHKTENDTHDDTEMALIGSDKDHEPARNGSAVHAEK